MKKFLLSLFAVMCLGFMANAETTFDFTKANEYNSAIDITSASVKVTNLTLTNGDFTITATKGSSTDAMWYRSNFSYRVYKGATMTIKSASEDMTEIVFNCGNNYFTAANATPSTGTLSASDKTTTWTGNTKELTITIGSKQNMQFTSIIINPSGEMKKVENIAEFIAEASTTPVEFANPLNVYYQNGANLYVGDATGALLVYGDLDQTYTTGDVIPAGAQGTFKNYNGCYELLSPSNFGAATTTTTIEPKVMALADITTADQNEYVKLNGVTIDNTTLTQGESTLVLYNKFAIENIPTEGVYDLVGVLTVFSNKIQFYPTEAPKATSAITDITIDENAPVEYFNLQGIRVDNPENGLYIRRQGNKVSKVLIK